SYRAGYEYTICRRSGRESRPHPRHSDRQPPRRPDALARIATTPRGADRRRSVRRLADPPPAAPPTGPPPPTVPPTPCPARIPATARRTAPPTGPIDPTHPGRGPDRRTPNRRASAFGDCYGTP